jgi:hypothetical protein
MQNPQCPHILFDAGGNQKRPPLIQLHTMYEEKTTPIRGSILDRKMIHSGRKSVGFSQVFCPNQVWTAVEEAIAASSELPPPGVEAQDETKEEGDFTGYMATTYTEVLDENVNLNDL